MQLVENPGPALNWYAAYTLPRHEKAVAEQLTQLGISSYLPLWTEVRLWNRRRVPVQLPLFPGYVFVRMQLNDKGRVLARPGVVRFVGFGTTLSVLPDDEMEHLKLALCNSNAKPYPHLTVGKRVKIRSGPFEGLQGSILKRKGKTQLVVTLDMIQSSMLLEVEAENALLAS